MPKAAGLPSTQGATPCCLKKQGKVTIPGNNRSDGQLFSRDNEAYQPLRPPPVASAKASSCLASESDALISPCWLQGSRQGPLLRGPETWLGDGCWVPVTYTNYKRGIVLTLKITPEASPSYPALVKSTYCRAIPSVPHFKQNFL